MPENDPDTRRARAFALACAGLAALSTLVSLWSLKAGFEGGITHEFCHYAEIGRNILEGRGYRTRMVYPFTLAVLDRRGIPFGGGEAAPVLDRFPLHAYLTAAAEAAVGANDAAPVALGMLLLAACAAATAWAGGRLFTPAEGLAAGLLVALNPSFQRGFVLWGLPDLGFCLACFASMAALCRGRWALAGVLAGLAWLARPNFILWVPLFAALAWRGEPAGGEGSQGGAESAARSVAARRLTLFLAPLAALSAPAWLYNLRWSGSPNPPTLDWNLAHHAVQDVYPLLSYREFPPWETLRDHLPELGRKFAFYLRLHLRDLPVMWQSQLAFPLSAAALLAAARPAWASRWGLEPLSPAVRRFALLALSMLALHILVFSFLRYEALAPNVRGRYLLWFAPAYFLLAARGASLMGARLGLRRGALPAFAAAQAALLAWWFSTPHGPPAHPEGLKASEWVEVHAAAKLAGGGLVVTNLPGQLAWYGRADAVALPGDPEELVAIGRRHRLGAVLISRLSAGEINQRPSWQKLLSDPAALGGFLRRAGLVLYHDFGTALLFVAASPPPERP